MSELDTWILGNGTLVRGGPRAEVVPQGAVAWAGDRISAAGDESAIRERFPNAHYLDGRGGIILPGLVNIHHHFYSALARGLDPGVRMRSFPQVLDRLWWRLDRALDTETVRISALLSAAECVRHGCTTVFDHHASPSCIEGSLDAIADAAGQAGISALLCYEVTDRNGPEGAAAGIEENLSFLADRADDPRIRGVVGLHASFTLRDETLALVAERRPSGSGCHIHVAEDPVDVLASIDAFGVAPVERLARFDLLDERALLAHAIHLEQADYERAAEAGAILIHNPESNANNGVGRLNVPRTAALGCTISLGTDGMSSSMLRALRFAFLTHRGATGDPSSGFEALPDLLAHNAATARRFFSEPLLGQLEEGAPADVIAVDSPPPTPISGENLFAHLAYGTSEAPVRHTVARGRVLLQDFRHTSLDPEELTARARELSPPLWERFHALDWNTPYLGIANG
ncbi:MAG: amidohydrolase family protein [Gemmatimonadales bacterium]